jgi:hypothetical protein
LVYHSKKWNHGGSQNWRLCYRVRLSTPLTQLNTWKEDNNCQSIWDKGEVLLGTLWGTCQELGKSLVWAPPHPEFPHPKHNKKRACMESRLSTFQGGGPLSKVESEQWTVHSPHQTQLGKKTPPPPHTPPLGPHPQEKKGGPFTPWLHVSLDTWKFYS